MFWFQVADVSSFIQLPTQSMTFADQLSSGPSRYSANFVFVCAISLDLLAFLSLCLILVNSTFDPTKFQQTSPSLSSGLVQCNECGLM